MSTPESNPFINGNPNSEAESQALPAGGPVPKAVRAPFLYSQLVESPLQRDPSLPIAKTTDEIFRLADRYGLALDEAPLTHEPSTPDVDPFAVSDIDL